MRSDMKKVLCERPRRGGKYSYNDYRAHANNGDIETLEDLPRTQGMRRPYVENWGDSKEFDDLIGPLRRFFQNRVGYRWDDVWSEICANLKGGSTVNDHLKDHARREVDTETVLVDGRVFSRTWGYLRTPTGLYVDPTTGVICRAPERVREKLAYHRYHDRTFYETADGVLHYRISHYDRAYRVNSRKYENAEFEFDWKKIADEQEAIRLKGIWYWIEFDTVPAPYVNVSWSGDQKIETMVYPTGKDFITREQRKSGQRYRSRKGNQMSSRDLRRHGLENVVK